jgi:hypothetical protein
MLSIQDAETIIFNVVESFNEEHDIDNILASLGSFT